MGQANHAAFMNVRSRKILDRQQLWAQRLPSLHSGAPRQAMKAIAPGAGVLC
jgi:hypothetical protein